VAGERGAAAAGARRVYARARLSAPGAPVRTPPRHRFARCRNGHS
jgi:hypothetical protein